VEGGVGGACSSSSSEKRRFTARAKKDAIASNPCSQLHHDQSKRNHQLQMRPKPIHSRLARAFIIAAVPMFRGAAACKPRTGLLLLLLPLSQ
jgi:hypothetical protein